LVGLKNGNNEEIIVKNGQVINQNFMEPLPTIKNYIVSEHIPSLTFNIRLLPISKPGYDIDINHTLSIEEMFIIYYNQVIFFIYFHLID